MQKNILFILMPDQYRDEEFDVPYAGLTAAGHKVDVAGFGLRPAQGSRGGSHTPNLLLSNLSKKDLKKYHALVIPGGPGSSTHLWDNPAVLDVINFFIEHKKLVATICHACVVLAQTGVLEGKEMAVFPSDDALRICKEKGAIISDEGCVVIENGTLITAQGPKFADQFTQAILTNL